MPRKKLTTPNNPLLRALMLVVAIACAIASGITGPLWGVSRCGPQTYGPPCSIEIVAYLPLGIAAFALAVWAGRGWMVFAVLGVLIATNLITIFMAGYANEDYVFGFGIFAVALTAIMVWVAIASRRPKKRQAPATDDASLSRAE
ncbi:hypothetical protein G7068_09060 [Leucobacter viscericola]|uniref:Uncharacterized protein n=1 Tax=Leucobacter viscericola TaxID=2714935 RepID=A0A6G7XG33_9MICO|nr:hypothetical protein [Leucobacter viscericola]QIK63331.1 hypothetical protein G7068_09060 [Leucobacter viscericola]